MKREGLLTGQQWSKDVAKVRDMPNSSVGKAKTKSKGHRGKFSCKTIDDDWDLATTSSRPHDTCGAMVKVSSHALDYDLNDDYDIYAACRAIDVACGAEVDYHTFDFDAVFDIDAACHAIDVACALKINDVDGDGKTCLVSDEVNLIDDALAHDVKCDSSPDDDDYENYIAHGIHQAGNTTLHKAVDDGVLDDERDDHYDNVKRDEISDALVDNHDPACTNMASCGPSVNESNDGKHDEISGACCVSSINDDNDSEISLIESGGNSLSSDWYHVACSDTDDWYLC